MCQRARRRARDSVGKPCGTTFRNDYALRAGRQRSSHDGAEVLWVFDAVEKDEQAGSGTRIARFQQILKAGSR